MRWIKKKDKEEEIEEVESDNPEPFESIDSDKLIPNIETEVKGL